MKIEIIKILIMKIEAININKTIWKKKLGFNVILRPFQCY